MISLSTCAILVLAMALAGLLCGMVIQKRKPGILRRLLGVVRPAPPAPDPALQTYGKWSIAIYEGPSPFNLSPAAGTAHPVITTECVTDTDAILVADPFLFRKDGAWHMFFEVMRRADERGVIAHAESADGLSWRYHGIVLEEKFHLSYPQVFEWEGEIFMVPESSADLSVRLYRAVSFPDRWEHAGTLLSGYTFADSTVFRHDGRWWMMVSTNHNDVLNLYHSEHLAHGWQPHPLNPVVRHNPHHARPAGRVVAVEGKLHRFAQDCAPDYGVSVFAFEITELTTTRYAERIVGDKPVLTRSGAGWNSHGMHHIDAWSCDGRWIAAVDGKTTLQDEPRRSAMTRS
jgi:hypothetical protein